MRESKKKRYSHLLGSIDSGYESHIKKSKDDLDAPGKYSNKSVRQCIVDSAMRVTTDRVPYDETPDKKYDALLDYLNNYAVLSKKTRLKMEDYFSQPPSLAKEFSIFCASYSFVKRLRALQKKTLTKLIED